MNKKKAEEQSSLDAKKDRNEMALDMVDDLSDKSIPIEKLLKWRKQGLSYAEIGNMIGRSKQAVHQRLQPYKDAIDNLPAFKENRADIFAILQARLLNSLTDDDIKRIPPGSRFTGVGILYDKERLERDKSTSNVAIADIETARITAEEAAVQARERAEARRQELIALQAEAAAQGIDLPPDLAEIPDLDGEI